MKADRIAQHKRNSRAGFTLIELMVVVGLMVVLIGAIGVMRTGGNESVAMTSAQSSLSALFTAARLQATASGTDVFVMVDLYPGTFSGTTISNHLPNPGYLRRFVVFKRDGNSDIPRRSGREFFLPEGIYFVPPQTLPSNTAYVGPTYFRWGTDGSTRKYSMGGGMFSQYGMSNQTDTQPAAGRSFFYGWRISSDGRIHPTDSTSAVGHLQMSSQIVLGAGGRIYAQGANPPQFVVTVANGYGARGLRISYYGQMSMVNNLDSFD